jgi:hypothetical protein
LRDLGAPVNVVPTTNFGWGTVRFNRVMYDLSLLSHNLEDDTGKKLNPNGSLQRLVTHPELYDNMNKMSIQMNDFFSGGKVMLKHLNVFAEKIANDPSSLARGALRAR